MKKYISWIMLGILGISGLSISIYFSIQPKPIPKIKYSLFSSPEEIGLAITHRLRLELSKETLIFLGIDPSNLEHYSLVNGFIAAMQKEGMGFESVVVDPKLPKKDLITHQEEIDLRSEMDRFKVGMSAAQSKNKKIAVILPTILASTLIDGSPVSMLMKDEKTSAIVFTIAELLISTAEESSTLYPCVANHADALGISKLGCLILTKSRPLYRKPSPGAKMPALMDQIGLAEYLILFRSRMQRTQ